LIPQNLSIIYYYMKIY